MRKDQKIVSRGDSMAFRCVNRFSLEFGKPDIDPTMIVRPGHSQMYRTRGLPCPKGLAACFVEPKVLRAKAVDAGQIRSPRPLVS